MQTVLSQEEVKRLKKMMRFENKARKLGFKCIAGIDEAGRGPLAGPVVAAACVLPKGTLIEGVDDSKKLLPSERYALFQKILSLTAVDYGIGVIDSLIIDQVNILQATFMAMMAAVSRLSQAPDYILVDGDKMPTTTLPGTAVIKGDGFSQSIAAASILAKVTRDNLMCTFDEKWPEYGFKSHKGYATPEHLLAIQKHGPCEIHRKSFEPIKSLTEISFFNPLSAITNYD